MKKWEYKLLEPRTDYDNCGGYYAFDRAFPKDYTIEEINALGEEGWEMVKCEMAGDGIRSAIFKREKL